MKLIHLFLNVLKKDQFAFDKHEFLSLLQHSKELNAAFYNKSIVVHLHTDGVAGHVSADLPAKTASGVQIISNVGFMPKEGSGIQSVAGEFVGLARSTHSSKKLSVNVPLTQEQYDTLAELTAKTNV